VKSTKLPYLVDTTISLSMKKYTCVMNEEKEDEDKRFESVRGQCTV
jgi:hypothetical protein